MINQETTEFQNLCQILVPTRYTPKTTFYAILNCPLSPCRNRYNDLTEKVSYVLENRLQNRDQRIELGLME